jgi:hypothetical protein
MEELHARWVRRARPRIPNSRERRCRGSGQTSPRTSAHLSRPSRPIRQVSAQRLAGHDALRVCAPVRPRRARPAGQGCARSAVRFDRESTSGDEAALDRTGRVGRAPGTGATATRRPYSPPVARTSCRAGTTCGSSPSSWPWRQLYAPSSREAAERSKLVGLALRPEARPKARRPPTRSGRARR